MGKMELGGRINRWERGICRRGWVRREKSARHGNLPYPMEVARFRLSCLADFSR